jgi:hypothetical protein
MRPLCLLVAAVSLSAADPSLLRYAPPDTSFILGVNFRALVESPVGMAAIAQAKSGAELARFIAETGFNPLEDIDEIVIAGEANKAKNSGSILVRGRFDPAGLERLSTQQFSAADYQGVRVFTRTVDEPFSVALLSRALLVAGDPERVRQTIRRGPGPGLAPELAAKAAELSAMHVWFAAVIPTSALASPDLPQGINPELAKAIRQISGGITFGNDVVFACDLLARTPKDAESIAGIVRMFIGLAASSNRDAKEAAAVLEKLSIRTEGPSVRLGLTIPQAELVRWAQQARERAAASQAPARPAPPPPSGVTVYSSPQDMGVVTLPPPK